MQGVRDGERWKARAEISDIDVPDTIQGVVLARVDRLRAEAKTVLQCASVIGRLFKYRLLEQLSRQERNLDRYLNEFEEKELVYEERTVPELEYTFKHAFTQEATYRGILEKRRQEFHLQVAREMERLYGERLEECYEELAHHYSRSEDVEKAVEYLLKAGEKAVRASAYENAISDFRKGIDLTGTLADQAAGAQREAELQTPLGWALFAKMGYASPEAEQAFSRARDLSDQLGQIRQLGWSLVGLAQIYLNRAAHDEAHKASEWCLDLAQKDEDPTLLMWAHECVARSSILLGKVAQALTHWERACSLYDPQRHRTLIFVIQFELDVLIRVSMAWALWFLGCPDRALEMSR